MTDVECRSTPLPPYRYSPILGEYKGEGAYCDSVLKYLLALLWDRYGGRVDALFEVREAVESGARAGDGAVEVHGDVPVGVKLEGGILRISGGSLPDVDLLALVGGAAGAAQELGVVEELTETTLALLQPNRALGALAKEAGGVGGL